MKNRACLLVIAFLAAGMISSSQEADFRDVQRRLASPDIDVRLEALSTIGERFRNAALPARSVRRSLIALTTVALGAQMLTPATTAQAKSTPQAAAAPATSSGPATRGFLAAPAKAEDGKRVLIYTGTTGYRHADGIDNGRPVVQAALEGARRHLLQGRRLVERGEGYELLSIDLREALGDLDAITGREVGERVLAGIFSQFCIGK